MATFVLVHGAWHGAWCWRRVARLLTRTGHDVFAPTLTGLCERSHLLTPAVDLDTHILDIVNELKWQELKDVVIVGHSYGGMVISGVAEKMEKAIASFVSSMLSCQKTGNRWLISGRWRCVMDSWRPSAAARPRCPHERLKLLRSTKRTAPGSMRNAHRSR
jgi:pimeloyl-ACP methyl ester carboxylesterase